MKIPSGRIPKFIAASSPQGLRRLMLSTQTKLGYGVQFFDIQFVGKYWYAWYYDNQDINFSNLGEQIAELS